MRGKRRNLAAAVRAAAALAAAGAGCSAPAPVAPATAAAEGGEGPGHRHERGKFQIADAGKYHALLTVHQGPGGQELHLFFETADDNDPRPVALPLASVAVQCKGDSAEIREVNLDPVAATAGAASHFAGKAPWLEAAGSYHVVARFRLEGEPVAARWRRFTPQKFTHQPDEKPEPLRGSP
jgi:hypothetical protein